MCAPKTIWLENGLPRPPQAIFNKCEICRIVDAQNGQSAAAQGCSTSLSFACTNTRSAARTTTTASTRQRGLVLKNAYNGRALMEHKGNDVHITVRAPYPERFLSMLTEEVKYLVESFWEGLNCDVMVPCIAPCGRKLPGSGLFDVQKLIESKRINRPEYPCPVCNEWHNIDRLLRNAPAACPISLDDLLKEFATVKDKLDVVNANTLGILSRIDEKYADFLRVFTDEAKEGPRLFSLVPVDRSDLNPREWMRTKFRLILWCEHSHLPLPMLNADKDRKKGVYEIELTRKWFKQAAPFLKVATGTLSLILPVAASGIKLALDDTAYKAIEEQLDFGKSVIDAVISEGTRVGDWIGTSETMRLEHGEAISAHGSTLRDIQALLKAKDPGFGGLVRAMNKRQEFLWVHPQFEKEY